jgi:hypothetical protein
VARALKQGIYDHEFIAPLDAKPPTAQDFKPFVSALTLGLGPTELASSGRYQLNERVTALPVDVEIDGQFRVADKYALYQAAKESGARAMLMDLRLVEDGSVHQVVVKIP